VSSDPFTPGEGLEALAGCAIAVTADRRAEEQIELIRRRGGHTIHGPVIRTVPLAAQETILNTTLQLFEHPPDVVVISTALALRGWWSVAESAGLGDRLLQVLNGAHVVVRGPKAAGAAVAVGVEVALRANTYQQIFDHEQCRLRMAPTPSPPRLCVLVDGAPESSLPGRFGDLGFETTAIQVYQWHLPDDLRPAERIVAAVSARTVDAVTFTSSPAVSNLVSVAHSMGLGESMVRSFATGAVKPVCVGPVTASRAQGAGFGLCIEPNFPRLGAMVQAMATYFAGNIIELSINGVPLSIKGRLVWLADETPVRLTDREHAVLCVLARRPGAVVAKQTLLDEVWDGSSDHHVVEVTVGRLRKRLAEAGDSIETVVRRGYRLAVR
jgi:uroporphyrinogen-III synthase